MGWKTIAGAVIAFLCAATDPAILPQIAAALPADAVTVTRLLGLLGLFLTIAGLRHAQAKAIGAAQASSPASSPPTPLPLPPPPDDPPGSRSLSGVIKAAVLLAVIALLVSACGASARQHDLSAAMRGLDASADAFSAWDGAHQKEIVARANTRGENDAGLAAYRAREVIVVEGFKTAYQAVAAAALGIGDVAGALAAAAAAYQLIVDIERKP